MVHLESILEEVQKEEKRKKKNLTRRWIITEALFYNYGDVLPLPKLMELKDKYCYRLIIDESYSLGILGKTGRGICEHFNIPPTSIEILTGNLAGAISSVGGYCCSNRGIIYHQRLNASGYVYSASLPPILTQAAMTAIDILDENPTLVSDLAANTEFMYKGLSNLNGMMVSSSLRSPVIHLRLITSNSDRLGDEETLQKIVDEALEEGILLARAQYTPESLYFPPPSIRICVSAANTKEQLQEAIRVIQTACDKFIPKTIKKKKDQETLDEAAAFLAKGGSITPKRSKSITNND